MALVAPVNLPYNIKTLWFDPQGLELSVDDKVVVKTARGLELGIMASDPIEVEEEQIKGLKTPLMPVVRVATDEDLLKSKEMEEKGREAMEVFRRLARETSEDMHPVSVEYMLDGERAVFYFESEERIDFRELVRKLASEFHVRIDMRQIGVRDEARIVGGLAHCGQIVCCKRLGGEFKPVSIRAAKDQDLSLNPQKISGLCGRLMCCLRYESDVYSEFKKTAPKVGAMISTPDGEGKVTEIDVPKESVILRIEDEKPVKVPVTAIEDLSENRKSGRISDEAWSEIMERIQSSMFEGSGLFEIPKFTTEDKLGEAKAVHREKRSSDQDGNRPKKSKGNGPSEGSKVKPRGSKRRSVKIDSGGEPGSQSRPSKQGGKGEPKNGGGSKNGSRRSSGKRSGKNGQSKKGDNGRDSQLRPGHKSSGLSHGGEQPNSSEGNKGSSSRRRRGNSRKG